MKISPKHRSVSAFAPASVGNSICGFDVLGFALEKPGDYVKIELTESSNLELLSIEGDAGKLSKDPNQNTATIALREFLRKIGSQQGLAVFLKKELPIGSGLGSSAASAVAALVAANEMFGEPLDPMELLLLAILAESTASGSAHADNVAPCLMGGFILTYSLEPLEVIKLPAPDKLAITIVLPEIEILTKKAREILPMLIPISTMTKQMASLGAFISALHTGDLALIGKSCVDLITEPARAYLIPGFSKVKTAALNSGALVAGISGAGPAMLAFSSIDEDVDAIGKAMQAAFKNQKIESTIIQSRINAIGAKVTDHEAL